MTETVFQARGLTKVYGEGDLAVHALRGVDMELYAGEMVVLLGASGSGKSTLLNILGGLDNATSGTVRYGDIELSQASERQLTRYRRHHVGFVFQFYNLIASLTALENVTLPAELAGDRRARSRGLELLALVGLSERADFYPSQLSGGEQQRVAIARAFITRPAILFADEPSANLDAVTGQRIEDLLFELNQQQGTTLVLVTHSDALAKRCQRQLKMQAGRFITEEQ